MKGEKKRKSSKKNVKTKDHHSGKVKKEDNTVGMGSFTQIKLVKYSSITYY
jgi:hypothetical protein